MAIAATHLVTVASGSDATSYTSTSITPTAGRLVLALVENDKLAAPDTPTVSGCGLTWVQVDTVTWDTGITGTKRLTLFRAMGASPTAGGVTGDFGINTQTGACISVSEFSGVDTTGSNGAGAIRQVVHGTADGVTSLTITLAAFSAAGFATYGGFAAAISSNLSVGSGFTLLGRSGHTTPNAGVLTEFNAGNDTSVDSSFASGNAAGIAVELVPSGAITGASAAAVGTNGAVDGSAAAAGASAVACADAGAPGGSAAAQGSSSTAESGSGALAGSGGLTGTAPAGVGAAGDARGAGQLAGSSGSAQGASGAAAGSGSLAGGSAEGSGAAGGVAGQAAASGSAAAAGSGAGAVGGGGALAGVAPLSVAAASALAGLGQLAGISAAAAGSSSQVQAGAQLAGVATFAFFASAAEEEPEAIGQHIAFELPLVRSYAGGITMAVDVEASMVLPKEQQGDLSQ